RRTAAAPAPHGVPRRARRREARRTRRTHQRQAPRAAERLAAPGQRRVRPDGGHVARVPDAFPHELRRSPSAILPSLMTGMTLGPYRLDAELGAGGMGKVWRAEVVGKAPGLEVGRVVALKIVHPHLLETPGFFKRFLREAEIGKAVVHE